MLLQDLVFFLISPRIDNETSQHHHLLWSPTCTDPQLHLPCRPSLLKVSSMDKETTSNNPADFASVVDFRPPESSESGGAGVEMVNYMLSNPTPQGQISLDKLSFADVMQFAEFGPKLSLNQSKLMSEDESYFLKFQVMGDKLQDDEDEDAGDPLMGTHLPLLPPGPSPAGPAGLTIGEDDGEKKKLQAAAAAAAGAARSSTENAASSVQQQLQFAGGGAEAEVAKGTGGAGEAAKNRRKRPRAMKTSEEVESQRMTHIAVERNRRRQMNEHLRVLRTLMPGSYVQRGDQASIIGGAIEFVRELEQLLQCLESQKRRRLFGNGAGDTPIRPVMDAAGQPPPLLPNHQPHQQQPQPFYPPGLPFPNALVDVDPITGAAGALREEMAENKSCLADIEVRLLGFDAMIKILSRRRPGQLIKTIAALEDLQFTILHTNITTIEQTVLYSFNVKIANETRCSAEDIANSVQQILSFIDANTS